MRALLAARAAGRRPNNFAAERMPRAAAPDGSGMPAMTWLPPSGCCISPIGALPSGDQSQQGPCVARREGRQPAGGGAMSLEIEATE